MYGKLVWTDKSQLCHSNLKKGFLDPFVPLHIWKWVNYFFFFSQVVYSWVQVYGLRQKTLDSPPSTSDQPCHTLNNFLQQRQQNHGGLGSKDDKILFSVSSPGNYPVFIVTPKGSQ